MKKILLLTFLIAVSCQSFAFVTQGHWRWRKDDGNETSATWLADQDSPATISSSSDNIRVRFQLYNTQSSASDIGTTVLTYSADGGSTWDSVSTFDNGIRAFILAGASANVHDGDATTQLLNGGAALFEPGKVIVTSNSLSSYNYVQPGDTTEYEWVIKPTANVAVSTTYLFRADTKPGDGTYGTAGASLITASILPIELTNFTIQPDKGGVKLQWTTASELNSDHFSIERNNSGILNNWKSITTVKANGTTSQSHTYTAFDPSPLNGTNYYRLKQFNTTGKSMESAIKTISFQGGRSGFSVFPNPSNSLINFSLANYRGNISAVLLDMNGKVIHHEVILSSSESFANYKLSLTKKLTPGIYVLQLNGNALKLQSKVEVK